MCLLSLPEMLINDCVLFDDGCCESRTLLNCRGNDGRITLDPPDVLRSNDGYVQLHCFDAEPCRPFQDDGAAGDFVNRSRLCDAHNIFSLLRRGELVNVEIDTGGHAAYNVNVVHCDMDDINV